MRSLARLATLALLSLVILGCHQQQKGQPKAATAASAKQETPALTAKAAEERADKLFESRDDPDKLTDALSLYEKASTLDSTPKRWLRLARAYELAGQQSDKKQREATAQYAKGFEAACKALEALAPGSTAKTNPAEERFAKLEKNSVDVLYHYALLRWRWAQTQGTAMEISLHKEILAAALRASQLDPGIHGAAPYRLLGELYAELPMFADGDLESSRSYFEKAISLAPEVLENRGALARSYAQKADPNLAITLWEAIIAADPNASRELAPENRLEQKKAALALADKPK